MTGNEDWFPGLWDEQLALAKICVNVLSASTLPPFGVPQNVVDSLVAQCTKAGQTLELAKSGERTSALHHKFTETDICWVLDNYLADSVVEDGDETTRVAVGFDPSANLILEDGTAWSFMP